MLLAVAAGPDLSAQISREVARQHCRLRGEGEEIVVCGSREQQRRYQVTDPDAPFDIRGSVPSVATERMEWIEEGDVGIQSCSAVGPGGWTGCALKAFKKRRKQKGWFS